MDDTDITVYTMHKSRLKCLNKVWQYFDVYDAENRTAICNKCNLVLSYRSTIGNLRKHYESKHGQVSVNNESDNEDMEDKMLDDGNTRDSDIEIKVNKSKPGPRKRSRAWKYFKESGLGDHTAICNLCGSTLSYYSSITNLVKHVRRKHPLVPLDNSVYDDYNEVQGSGAEDNKESKAETKPRPARERKIRPESRSKVWKYFTKVDDAKLIAKCNICSNELSYYSSVGNLMKHVVSQHGLKDPDNTISSDEDDVFEGMASTDDEDEDNQKEKSRPMVWLYFKCLDPVLKISMCLICMKRLSSTSVANLKKHLMAKHPQVKLPDEQDNEKQILVGEDGQMYEIETNNDEEHKLNESTQIDTVYLEDYMDDEPERSKYEPKRTKYEPESTIYKPRTQRKQMKRLKTNNVCKIMSSNEELSHERYESKKEDSLDHFAKYATSLLRQLPKNISDQLQMEFIKEILNAKIKNQTVTDVTSNNSYSITVTNLVSKGNNDIPNLIPKENNVVPNNGVDSGTEN